MSELVAGHRQDHQPPAAVAGVELVHLVVVPGGGPSERRHVLDQDHFAFKGGEVEHFSADPFSGDLKELGGHCNKG